MNPRMQLEAALTSTTFPMSPLDAIFRKATSVFTSGPGASTHVYETVADGNHTITGTFSWGADVEAQRNAAATFYCKRSDLPRLPDKSDTITANGWVYEVINYEIGAYDDILILFRQVRSGGNP